MHVTGVIAEYNPFHNGHLYQLKKIKENTNTDFIVVVMSGNFMQRGEPALIDKFKRASLALQGGADLVLELPALYSTASAELFATGGVTTLHKMNVVDSLCFGCETDDLTAFTTLSNLLLQEPASYKEVLAAQLKTGKSFPAARMEAVLSCAKTMGISSRELASYTSILSNPNNILGLEYMKCLTKLDSSIQPAPILRLGNDYNEKSLTGTLSSATAIRSTLFLGETKADFSSTVPAYSNTLLLQGKTDNELLSLDDFSSILNYKLILEQKEGFSSYLDCSEDFSNKIMKNLSSFSSWSQFVELLKTKELTHTRINRILCHILLNIKASDLTTANSLGTIPYLRVLGFKKSSNELLSAIKKSSDIPLITKLANASSILDSDALALLEKDILAADIYRSTLTNKTKRIYKNEFLCSPVILP